MKIFRKIAAVITAAAIAVAAAASTVVTAGADSIYDTAKAISSGKSVSTTIRDYDTPADYMISVSKSGQLKLDIESQMYYLHINVYDENGKEILPDTDYQTTSGSTKYYDFQGYLNCTWNSTIQRYRGTVSYPVEKGKYYLRFDWDWNIYAVGNVGNGNGKLTFTATFPGATESTAKINYLTINLKKGDTLSLGASVSGSGTVKWSSSKPTVASVSSSGKVTAKKAGSAIITAKCGSSSQKIKIVVS